MQTLPAARRVKQRKPRIRYSNRLKCLLCYVAAFALPLLWQWAALRFLYPYRLAGTAPDAAGELCRTLPFLQPMLQGYAQAAIAADGSAQALRAAMAAREQSWMLFVAACALCAWLVTLVAQLLWRISHRSALQASQAVRRAIRGMRANLTAIWLVNLVFALCVWVFGVRCIAGATLWDLAAYFPVYALNALAAWCVSRLAASPVISARHGFFKRI